MIFIFVGPPGSGKGTQSAMLAKEFGYKHVSSGDILRGLKDNHRIQKIISQGGLVPDNDIFDSLKSVINEYYSKGVILDGFPRTKEQANMLDHYCREQNYTISSVIFIDVSQDEIISRLQSRVSCTCCFAVYNLQYNSTCPECGHEKYAKRTDDDRETVLKRLEEYNKKTKSVVEYYKGINKLRSVRGKGNMIEVYSKVKTMMKGVAS